MKIPCHIPCASVHRISSRSEGFGSRGVSLPDCTEYYQIALQKGCKSVNGHQQRLEVTILLTPTQTLAKK